MDMWMTIGFMALIFVGSYFLLIRPQKKRFQELQDAANNLQPGTRVLLTSGLFGTVKHVGTSQMVVELAPDLDVTVLKQALAKVVTADEEEFEYEDVATGEVVEPLVDADPVVTEPAAEPVGHGILPPSESGMAPVLPPTTPEEVRPSSTLLPDEDEVRPARREER